MLTARLIVDLVGSLMGKKVGDKVKGGRMATEAGDVTQDGSRGGDTG